MKRIIYKPIRSITNGGDRAKISVQLLISDCDSVVIKKYVLSEKFNLPEKYVLVKRFKNFGLFMEFITLRTDTLFAISSSIHHSLNLQKKALNR